METSSQPAAVFCLQAWGANSYGQLGQKHQEDRSSPGTSDISALDAAVRTLTGGGGHSVVVTENGRVWTCGQNHRGQLGLGHCRDVSTLSPCLSPSLPPCPSPCPSLPPCPSPCPSLPPCPSPSPSPSPSLSPRVSQVSCGWDFTLALTDGGQLLACGSNVFGQLGVNQPITHSSVFLLLETLTEPVVSVAAGLRHSLAVTGGGVVYQWGTGLSSQAKRALSPLAVPAHLCSTLPSVVPGLGHVTPHMVAAGSSHCVYLTGAGEVYLWGSNKHGQLVSSEPFLSSPSLLSACCMDGEPVSHVWSGWTHLVAQTVSGRVWTWGRADYGQLGRALPSSEDPEEMPAGRVAEGAGQGRCHPAEVPLLHGASQIACGSEHNLAIVGAGLLSWGWDEHGMCGHGSLVDVHRPRPVPGLKPLLIGCGAGHSLALTLS